MPPKEKKLPAVAGGQPDEEEEVMAGTLVVTDGDRAYRLRSDEYGPADTMACRQQTGLPVEHFLNTPGLDTALVIIWLSRRIHGEPNLAFQSVLKKYKDQSRLRNLKWDIEWDGDDDDGDDDPLPDDD